VKETTENGHEYFEKSSIASLRGGILKLREAACVGFSKKGCGCGEESSLSEGKKFQPTKKVPMI